jgi:hypothetical protein
MPKYIHNKSTYKVSLIDSKILLTQGEKLQIEDSDAEHPDVTHAIRSGWVTIEGAISKTKASVPAPAITFTKDPMQGSDTIPVVKPKEDARSSAIGSTEEPEISEATVTKKAKRVAHAATV